MMPSSAVSVFVAKFLGIFGILRMLIYLVYTLAVNGKFVCRQVAGLAGLCGKRIEPPAPTRHPPS